MGEEALLTASLLQRQAWTALREKARGAPPAPTGYEGYDAGFDDEGYGPIAEAQDDIREHGQ